LPWTPTMGWPQRWLPCSVMLAHLPRGQGKCRCLAHPIATGGQSWGPLTPHPSGSSLEFPNVCGLSTEALVHPTAGLWGWHSGKGCCWCWWCGGKQTLRGAHQVCSVSALIACVPWTRRGAPVQFPHSRSPTVRFTLWLMSTGSLYYFGSDVQISVIYS